jgi:4-amino-4-deoxy-L-arabinose transferase-like glycosyltransferase
MKELFTKMTIVILAVAICFRLALFGFALQHLPPSSDEAWPALMAFHILKGEFPVVYWGQSYMGTQESFIGAALIPIFGFNILTARLYPLLFSIFFLWISYLLARKLYGQTAGIVTLALLAIPAPYLAMCGALIPPDNCLALTTLGSLAFLILADLVYGTPDQKQWWKYILLGLTLGYTFWLHILVLSYIGVTLLFLFFQNKVVWLKGNFWAGVFAFCIGSLPLLWYNATHDFATFTDVGRTADWAQSWVFFKELFGITLHFLIGLKVMLYRDNSHFVSLPGWLAFLLAAIWIGALLLAIVPRFRSLLRMAFLSIKGADGTGLLLALIAATAYMFCRSSRAGWDNVRYILPMMSALPILLAVGLARIREWSRPLFAVLLSVVIGAQAWGNLLLVRAWNDPRIVGKTLDLPDTSQLFAFLKERGIRHAYAHLWLSYRMTFESQERFICSEPYNQRYPGREVKFIDQVQAAANVAYIHHDTLRLPDDFEDNLKAIGGSYSKIQGYSFTVYYDFKPPYGPGALREISRAGWKLTANRNTEEAGKAADNNPASIWETGQAQATGMWFQADLGRLETVCKIRFDLGGNITDYPRGYKVELSKDGELWKKVLAMGDMGGNLFWEGSHPRILVKGDFFTAAFAPAQARYVRMTLTGTDRRFYWSIAELRMFGPENKTAP